MKKRRFILITLLILALLSYMMLAMKDENLTINIFGLFWDLKAFTMMLLIPLFVTLTTYSFKDIAEILVFSFQMTQNNIDRVKYALAFFKYLQVIYIFSGILIFLLSMMIMLSDLSPEHMGRSLGTALCAIIYAFLIALLLISPIKNKIEQRLLELNN